MAEESTSEPFFTPLSLPGLVLRGVRFSTLALMCDICGDANCEHELKHLVYAMVAPVFADKYPKLVISDEHCLNGPSNSVYVIRPSDKSGAGISGTVALQICCFGDYMLVYRAIPGYESDAEKVYAADPEFITKIFDVLEGRRPVPKWN